MTSCDWLRVEDGALIFGHCLIYDMAKKDTKNWSIFSETEKQKGRVNVIQHTVGTVPQHTPSQSMAQILNGSHAVILILIYFDKCP